MSKAFTSESDFDDAIVEPAPLPAGVRNYMTKAGAEAFRQKIEQLEDKHRGLPLDDVANRAAREKIERTIRFLRGRLEAAHVIDPLTQPKDRVSFGATVTIALERPVGADETWRIVGIDETDMGHGAISWMSPLAGALLEKRLGERVHFMDRVLTIRSIKYSA